MKSVYHKDSSVPEKGVFPLQERLQGKLITSRDDPEAPSRENDKESLDIKDHSGHVPKRVYNLSITNLKHLSCNPGQKAMFLLHPQKKATYVGCYEDTLISGHYCPEFNTERVQTKHSASCNVKICNYSYKASEGYKFRKCFEIYGGISCPNIRELNSCTTLSTSLMIFLSCLVISFIFVIFLFFYICCIGYCIRKRYQNDIGYLS